MARPNDTPKIAAKRADETCMVSQMIALWCRAHHSEVASVHSADAPRIRLGMRSVTLCPDCAELNAYATARIAACPHMETKTFCSACPAHCYRPAMRERIRSVMRWSGPRMIRYRPIAAIKHAIVTIRSKRSR